MSDGDLLRAIQDSDPASLTTLYQRHVHGVWRFVRAHLSWDREATEDVVSETFLAAIRSKANPPFKPFARRLQLALEETMPVRRLFSTALSG